MVNKLVALAALFGLSVASFANVIGVNFAGPGNGAEVEIGSSTSAGAVTNHAGWNNLQWSSFVNSPLLNSQGGTSGVTLSSTTPNNTQSQQRGALSMSGRTDNGDNRLMSGYITAQGAGNYTTITLDGLGAGTAFEAYDIYVYFGPLGHGAHVHDGTTSYYLSDAGIADFTQKSHFVQATSTENSNVAPANYAVFSGTAGSVTLSVSSLGSKWGDQVGIHGIQIVGMTTATEPETDVVIATGDGLSLEWAEGDLHSVGLLGTDLTEGATAGGFSFMDYNTSSNFSRFVGTMSSNNQYSAQNDGLLLQSRFIETNDYIEVEATLESVSGADRAIWMEFRLPLDSADWTWWDSINVSRQVDSTDFTIQNKLQGFYDILKPEFREWESGDIIRKPENRDIPFAVAANANAGVAMAIPPTDPVIFIAGCDEQGLYLRWAVGLTEKTAKFPSQANLKFRIYPVSPEYGLRDALAKYYDWFPKYYDTDPSQFERFESGADSGWARGGLDHNNPDYVERNEDAEGIIAYFNLKGLARDVATSAEADGVDYAAMSNQEFDERLLRPEVSFQWLAWQDEGREIFESSHLTLPDDKYWLWGGGGTDVVYPLNPDPDLVVTNAQGEPLLTQGEFMFNYFTNMNATTPYYGIHIDMVGGRSQALNYRAEHLAYTDHPVTFDLNGNVGMHLKTGFYEFFEHLRDYSQLNNFGNEAAGMKMLSFKHQQQETSVPGVEEEGTRFFNAAVVDCAWHEGSINAYSWNRYDIERTFMGRKMYRPGTGLGNNSEPDQPWRSDVEYITASQLAYGLPMHLNGDYYYTTNDPFYNPLVSNYHYRDADLWAGYDPVKELIMHAGWEPVTHATLDLSETVCERFGNAPPYYFTIWNEVTNTTIRISIDLQELGIADNSWHLNEITWRTPLSNVWVDANSILHADVDIDKNRTAVIRLSDEPELDRPTPTSPENGTSISTATPLLSWNKVFTASDYEIRLTDITDGVVVLSETGLLRETYQLTEEVALTHEHSYELAVKANGIGDDSWETSVFTVSLALTEDEVVFQSDFNAAPQTTASYGDVATLNLGTDVGTWTEHQYSEASIITNITETGDMMMRLSGYGHLKATFDQPVNLELGGEFSFDFRPDIWDQDRWLEVTGFDTQDQPVFGFRFAVFSTETNFPVMVYTNAAEMTYDDGVLLGPADRNNNNDPRDKPMNSIKLTFHGDQVSYSGNAAYGLVWQPLDVGVLTSSVTNLNSIKFEGLYNNTKVLLDNIQVKGTFSIDYTTPPAAPAGLSIMDGINSVELDWADNTEGDLAGYTVYRSTTSGSGYSAIASDVAVSDYIDTTAANHITYYYVVTAVDTNSNESALSSEVSAQPGLVSDPAVSDSAVLGSVSGTLADAGVNDNVYHAISEVLSGSTSALEHKWVFNVTGAELVTFYAEAHHSANSEGDDFIFAYSTNDVDYIDMITVVKTSDDDTAQFYALPSGLSGTVYIRVLDADRTDSNTQLDTIHVDALFIVSEESTVAPGPATTPAPEDVATNVALNIQLGWTAGLMTASHDVYFGTNPTPGAGEFQGNQSGSSFTPGVLANSTTYYWAVDEINNSGTTAGPVWSFTTVPLINQPPVFLVDPINKANGEENAAYSGSIASDASDPESDSMTFSKVSGPAWLSVAANGTLSGTPGAGDVGLNAFTVQVVASGGSDTATLNVTVITAPAIPAAPSGLSASVISRTEIDLSWTDNANNETGFKIERSKRNNTSFSEIATVGPNVTSFSDTGLRKRTDYFYRVRAMNSDGDSSYSNEATAKTLN